MGGQEGGREGKLFDNSCGFIVSNASINEFKPEPVYALIRLTQPWVARPARLSRLGEKGCVLEVTWL